MTTVTKTLLHTALDHAGNPPVAVIEPSTRHLAVSSRDKRPRHQPAIQLDICLYGLLNGDLLEVLATMKEEKNEGRAAGRMAPFVGRLDLIRAAEAGELVVHVTDALELPQNWKEKATPCSKYKDLAVRYDPQQTLFVRADNGVPLPNVTEIRVVFGHGGMDMGFAFRLVYNKAEQKRFLFVE